SRRRHTRSKRDWSSDVCSSDLTILYDVGDWNKNDVVNYLQSQQIANIDLIIISHPHADHIGQLAEIVQTFATDEVWMSGNESSSDVFQKGIHSLIENDVDYEEP